MRRSVTNAHAQLSGILKTGLFSRSVRTHKASELHGWLYYRVIRPRSESALHTDCTCGLLVIKTCLIRVCFICGLAILIAPTHSSIMPLSNKQKAYRKAYYSANKEKVLEHVKKYSESRKKAQNEYYEKNSGKNTSRAKAKV